MESNGNRLSKQTTTNIVKPCQPCSTMCCHSNNIAAHIRPSLDFNAMSTSLNNCISFGLTKERAQPFLSPLAVLDRVTTHGSGQSYHTKFWAELPHKVLDRFTTHGSWQSYHTKFWTELPHKVLDRFTTHGS